MTDKELQQSPKEIVLDYFPVLMLEKGYTKMTVQDILKMAGIGRTTFYAHFTSKEDVLKQSVGRLRDGLLQAVKANEIPQAADTRFAFSLYFFMHIGSHHKIYDDLIGRDDFFIIERYFLRMLAELIRSELIKPNHNSAQQIQLEFITQHIVGAIWTTGMWWLERKQMSAQQMNDSFQTMVFSGLEKSLQSL